MASSVSPSSSASNSFCAVESIIGIDVMGCLAEIGKLHEGGVLSVREAAAMCKQVFPAYQAYVRKAGFRSAGSSSVASASPVRGGVGSVKAHGAEEGGVMKKLMSPWRKLSAGGGEQEQKPAELAVDGDKVNPSVGTSTAEAVCLRDVVTPDASALPVVSSEGMGLCSKLLFKSGKPELGSWPTLGQVLAADGSAVVTLKALRELRVTGGVDGAHLSGPGPGDCALDVLAALVACGGQVFDEGSLGAALAACVRRRGIGVVPGLAAKYSQYTRMGGSLAGDSQVVGLRGFLEKVCGEPLTAGVDAELSLVRKSAALLGTAEKIRSGMFAAVGDAALTLHVAVRMLRVGAGVQEYQGVRGSVLTNSAMSGAFVKKFPLEAFAYPAGVDPSQGRVGASFFEALVGVVYEFGSAAAVAKLCDFYLDGE